jgi:hypothetical protein
MSRWEFETKGIKGADHAMGSRESAREFYDHFREQFAFLEASHAGSSSRNIMSAYHEATYSQGYPWWHSCGFSNVFLMFELQWDPRDGLFSLTVSRDRNANILDQEGLADAFYFDDILRHFHPGWTTPYGEVDIWEGRELVERYAAATRPHAAEIFVPGVRPSTGFNGFSWRTSVNPIHRG